MCGVVGVLCNRTLANDFKNVARMNQYIAHRGPDGSGIHESNFGVLGHSRLAIIDSVHGHQPMLSKCNRYVLVFNGEIYNYIELRTALISEGVVFSTHSDTEVLLNILIRYRENAIHKLNGMFAFCFLDTYTGDWLIARDHFGVKPLYLYQDKERLYFASEIKAFKGVDTFHSSISNTGLSHYLTFQLCLEEHTLFNGVIKVKPGHYIKGKHNQLISEVEYWKPQYHTDFTHTEEYFTEKLEYLIHDSLKLQVRSDVPLGAYLSGGLDSSTVATYAAEVLKSGLPLFTGRFAEGQEYDESEYAKAVSDRLGGDLHLITPSANDFVEHLPHVIYSLDEPLAGPGVFPQFMVSQAAANYVKVMLGGQGGDEIFGGYARYLVAYLEQSIKNSIYGTEDKNGIPLSDLAANLPLLEQYKPMLSKFWSQGLFDEPSSRYFSLINRSPDAESILTPESIQKVNIQSNFSDFMSLWNSSGSDSYLNQMSYFDMKTLLPALLHVEDRVSMAASIESRVPLLDHRIVDLVNTMPASMKYQQGKTKSMLQKTVANRLPSKVLLRKDKMGFPVPLNNWMKGGVVREFVIDTLCSHRSLNRGIFNKDSLYNAGDLSGVGARQLWGMLSLELWHQKYIDN